MKYEVTYTESYSGTYEVEANSREEAEEMVKENIWEGKFKGPDDCYESTCKAYVAKEISL